MIKSNDFPRLDEQNHHVTSQASADYNCIAWCGGDTEHWWQPGSYWPVSSEPDDYGMEILVQGFSALGYTRCGDGNLEAGFEKIALYGSSSCYTHAARQLPAGRWTSKLGRSEDIEHHTPQDLAGGIYGEVGRYMKEG